MQQKIENRLAIIVNNINFEESPQLLGDKVRKSISDYFKSDIDTLGLTVIQYILLTKLQASKELLVFHADWCEVFRMLPEKIQKKFRKKLFKKSDFDTFLSDLKKSRDPSSFAYHNLKEMSEIGTSPISEIGTSPIIEGDTPLVIEKNIEEADISLDDDVFFEDVD